MTAESQIVERIRASLLPSLARDTTVDAELLRDVLDDSPGATLTDEEMSRIVYDLGLIDEPGAVHDTSAWLAGRSVGTAISEELVAGCARAAQMSTSRLQRILDGQAHPSSLDIALLAETLVVEVHWLITGGPDPMRMRVICVLPNDGEDE